MKIVFDSEAELEAFIHDKFKEEGLCCIDGTYPDFMFRQFNCGVYGTADLVSFDLSTNDHFRVIEVIVYELKKEKITAEAFAQVSRYATAIKQSINAIDELIELSITCALVGTEIDESCYILNNSEFLFYKVFFNPESGVDFKESSDGWHRKDAPIKFISYLIENEFSSGLPEPVKNEH